MLKESQAKNEEKDLLDHSALKLVESILYL